MEKVSKCLICGSSKLKKIETRVSDFVSIRTNNTPPKLTNLCYCRCCSFAFYEDRLTDDENGLLYAGYRNKEYQELREKCEPWYTKSVNDALNNDSTGLSEQKRVIDEIIKRNIDVELKVALDYGGNEGKTFTELIGTKEKYVYDISGIPTIDGVEGISNGAGLINRHYDFIMCNHLFEHLSYPMETLKHLKVIGDNDTYYYLEVPSESPFNSHEKIKKRVSFIPAGLYIFLRKMYYLVRSKVLFDKAFCNTIQACPMHEHVNFYTLKSMRTMIEGNGFRVIDIQENEECSALGRQPVLSCLFKKQ